MSHVPGQGTIDGLQTVRSEWLRSGDPEGVPELRGPGLGVIEPAECERCAGEGFVLIPDKKGNRFAQTCDCQRLAAAGRAMLKCGIPPRYAAESFDTYRPTHSSQSFALVKARGMAGQWPVDRVNGLALIGPVGTGKTHLAISVMREVVSKGARCRFANVRELLKTVRASFGEASGAEESEILRPLLAADLAVLDDLGAARDTPWAGEMIEHIINTRYDNALATIITDNHQMRPAGWKPDGDGNRYTTAGGASMLTLGDRIGTRMLSRLQQMCDVVQVEGDDYRARRRG